MRGAKYYLGHTREAIDLPGLQFSKNPQLFFAMTQ